MRNIFLVGAMGAGKTACGQELAGMLRWKFVDLDRVLEEAEGRSIAEIFQSRGEPYFRKREKQLFHEVASTTEQVVATGGGTVLDPDNRALAKKMGVMVYLKADLKTLWERVKDCEHRPLLVGENPVGLLGHLLKAREPFYEEASVTVKTDGRQPSEIALEIAKALGLRQQASGG